MKRSIMLALTALSLGAAFPAMAACTDPASAEVDWEGCNVGDVDLSGANLTGAKLSKANLGEADLSGANLSGTNLHHTDLSRANLSGANLTKATLTYAKLTNANLSGATWTDGRICAADSVETCD